MDLIDSFYIWFATLLRAGMTAASVMLAFSVLTAGIGFITTRNVGSMIVKAGGMIAFYSFLSLMVFTIPLKTMQLTNDMLHATQPVISDSVDTAVDTVRGDVTQYQFGQGGVIYLTPEQPKAQYIPPTSTPDYGEANGGGVPLVVLPTVAPAATATPAATSLPFPSTAGGG